MRVHRDTRFSRDKTPYKTNIGIQFRHEQGRDVHAPGYYVHIDPQSVFVGAGVWRPAARWERYATTWWRLVRPGSLRVMKRRFGRISTCRVKR